MDMDIEIEIYKHIHIKTITVTVLFPAIGHVGIADLFNYLPLRPVPSASTSAGGGSLPAGVTQPSFLKSSGPLAVLPELDCCSFPLTLITGPGNTKTSHRGLPVFQAYPSYPHGVVATQFPLTARIDHPRQHSNSLLCVLIPWPEEPKAAR